MATIASPPASESQVAPHNWRQIVASYQHPDLRHGLWQVLTSFSGFFLLLVAMYQSLAVGWWLTLLLAFPTAGFVIRIFIIQHDCGHGSFWASRRANELTGTLCSLCTGVAFRYWRRRHAVHHATHGLLEKRGRANHPVAVWAAQPLHAPGEERATGDVWTMTIDEYLQAPTWKRLAYRACRHPLYLFAVEPMLNFLVAERLPLAASPAWRRGERASVWLTDLALVAIDGGAIALWGLGTFLAIVLPVAFLAGGAAVWIFYVQHQFENSYWEYDSRWSFTLAALRGSSYFKLPGLLRWFSGNIGYHHIHHLSPIIPNYRLQACHEENHFLQQVTTLSLRESFRTASLALWDPQTHRLVSFREGLAGRSGRSSAPSASA